MYRHVFGCSLQDKVAIQLSVSYDIKNASKWTEQFVENRKEESHYTSLETYFSSSFLF